MALDQKAKTGDFPSSRAVMAATLEISSDALSGQRKPGNGAHLEQIIAYRFQAVALSTQDNKEMPARLGKLAASLLKRDEVRNGVPDIDRAIAYSTRAVQLHQEADARRMAMLGVLVRVHLARFERFKQTGDIDLAIEYQKETASILGDNTQTDWPIVCGRFKRSGRSNPVSDLWLRRHAGR
ncbi:hypothetical protein BDV93DRAFT_515932 [Ceratobasidium sp. AG-I]|nr:hypothetical protein BDV93DRAFT_515932 [Ceratobasidium sp. AG-I]